MGSAGQGVVSGSAGAAGNGQRTNRDRLRSSNHMRAQYGAGACEHNGLAADAGAHSAACAKCRSSKVGAGVVSP